MPRFFPIDAGVTLDAVRSDLLRIDWGVNHLSADFILPDDTARALRVRFDVTTIVRLLDEMPLSIETEPEEREGMVKNHFAYRVENGAFAESQAAALEAFPGTIRHYQFITGWGCMDVLSSTEPSFEVVANPS